MRRVSLLIIVTIALVFPAVRGEVSQLERRTEKPKGKVLVKQLPTGVEGERNQWNRLGVLASGGIALLSFIVLLLTFVNRGKNVEVPYPLAH